MEILASMFLYRFDYISVQDIDEVLTPRNHSNWAEMMTDLEREATKIHPDIRSSYVFENVYFLDNMTDASAINSSPDVPSYMHMMHHINRSFNYTTGIYIKCLHNTLRVLILHNHLPMGCLPNNWCFPYVIDPSVGHMQHYRAECTPDIAHICHLYKKVIVEDKSLWRWKDEVVHGTTATLRKVGLLNSEKDKR